MAVEGGVQVKLDAYWQLEGTLECTTPMHIGDGASEVFDSDEGGETVPAEVQTVARTVHGNARIPGTALKGVLRRACSGDTELNEKLFGKIESGEMGGLVQFLDACSETRVELDEKNIHRRTAIDDIAGTAENHKLFAKQLVPCGTKFSVRIRGKSYDPDAWKSHVGFLNAALNLSSGGGLQFGASDANDKGKCKWTLSAVRVMDAKEVQNWLEDPKPIDTALGGLPNRLAEIDIPAHVAESPACKSVEIKLHFNEHFFLVNDPSKTRKRGDPKGEGHSYVARRDGNSLLLPAESFRGVLAHQASKIACTRDKTGKREEVKRGADSKLPGDIGCVTRLFGGPGWRSVLDISDFKEVLSVARNGVPTIAETLEPNTKVQQFVAVDRFTAAGGSDKMKFDAEGGWQPCLQGSVTINLQRLRLLGEDVRPSLGLLALVLRDLAEGDLTFGWGAGKGYGWAEIDTQTLTPVQWVENALREFGPGSVKEWIKAWEEGGI
jgi:CRISPR/Cas system CSM-associated protein Csm3 (group 7 of RAMP superfamily)